MPGGAYVLLNTKIIYRTLVGYVNAFHWVMAPYFAEDLCSVSVCCFISKDFRNKLFSMSLLQGST